MTYYIDWYNNNDVETVDEVDNLDEAIELKYEYQRAFNSPNVIVTDENSREVEC